ncbi:MAG: ABC transporter permease [Candidatus Heimdallarchaeota archaeon]|nr:ABC transporter permease [Candidatus Heimdallarchaeota archaeon]
MNSAVKGVFMKMMKQLLRSKWTVPYLLLFPLFFILMFWLGFSTGEVGMYQTYTLGIVNQDQGIGLYGQIFENTSYAELITSGLGVNESVPFSQYLSGELIYILNQSTYQDGKSIFKIQDIQGIPELEDQIEFQNIDAGIIFSENYSLSILTLINDYWFLKFNKSLDTTLQQLDPNIPDFPHLNEENITIVGDANYQNYQIVREILLEITHFYTDISLLLGLQTIDLKYNYNLDTQEYSVFELLCPGLIMFGIIIQPSLFASFLCEEFRPGKRKFDRILLSPLSPWEYILGTFALQVILMILQSIVLFYSTVLLGFNPVGSIPMAIVLSFSLLPFNAGLNYLAAAYLHDEDTVGYIYGFGTPILGYASGAFTSLPTIILLKKVYPTISGNLRDLQLWDLLPTTHITNVLKSTLLWNLSLTDVFFDLMIGLSTSTIFMIVSMWIFMKRRWR